jgi:hypothetical protein
MGVAARSSHGTLIAHQPAATPGVFTTVAEIGDIDNLGTMRNSFDVSVHNEDIDTHVIGVLRRDPVSFPMNYVAANAGHIAMRTSHYAGTVDGWRVTWPDDDYMIFSGAITNMSKPAPVDGALRQTITIRPSGLFIYNGAVIGEVE